MYVFKAEKLLRTKQYTRACIDTEIEIHKGICSDLFQGEWGPFPWSRTVLSNRTFCSVGKLHCPVW